MSDSSDIKTPKMPTRAEWKLWIQDLPRTGTIDMNAWLDAVEIWLEQGPWMPKE